MCLQGARKLLNIRFDFACAAFLAAEFPLFFRIIHNSGILLFIRLILLKVVFRFHFCLLIYQRQMRLSYSPDQLRTYIAGLAPIFAKSEWVSKSAMSRVYFENIIFFCLFTNWFVRLVDGFEWMLWCDEWHHLRRMRITGLSCRVAHMFFIQFKTLKNRFLSRLSARIGCQTQWTKKHNATHSICATCVNILRTCFQFRTFHLHRKTIAFWVIICDDVWLPAD